MASKKQLKKEIDSEVFGIISDCFLYSELHPEKKQDEVSKIIEDAAALRNDLFSRINNPGEFENPKETKNHYRTVKAELHDGVEKLCKRLSTITAKKSKK